MPKSRQYHEDAILYNAALADAAENVSKQITDPEIRKWPTAVGKQHRFHESRHKKALAKLDKGEPYSPVEVIPEGLDLPDGESVFDPVNPPEAEDTRSLAEQQADFAASMAQEEPEAHYHDAKTGQFVSEEYAEHHPATTVLVTETSHDEPREIVPVEALKETDA